MLRRALIAVTIALAPLAVACTPEQVQAYLALDPASRAAVDAELQRRATPPPNDCWAAMRATWPPRLHAWAGPIMVRESGASPYARNRSGASGCFQMMLPLHSGRFVAAGCSPADWANAWCNARAAWLLYQADPTAWRFSG